MLLFKNKKFVYVFFAASMLFSFPCIADESTVEEGNPFNKVMHVSDDVNLFSGDVSFSHLIYTLKNANNNMDFDISLKYSSNIYSNVRAKNRIAPTSWVGLGWHMAFSSILCDHNSTVTPNDDTYYYITQDGAAHPMSSYGGAWYINDKPFITCRRYKSSGIVDGWQLVDNSGKTYTYGDKYNKASQATRYTVGYLEADYVGSGSASSDVVQKYPYQWDLESIEDMSGNKVEFEYQQPHNQTLVGPYSWQSTPYTQASYIKRIISYPSGMSAEFVLCDKVFDTTDPAYCSPNKYAPSEPNSVVGLYEKKLLDYILIKGNDGEEVRKIDLTYSDLRTNEYGKKILHSLSISSNVKSVEYIFTYYDDPTKIDDDTYGNYHFGALKSIQAPTGHIKEFFYKKSNALQIVKDPINVVNERSYFKANDNGKHYDMACGATNNANDLPDETIDCDAFVTYSTSTYGDGYDYYVFNLNRAGIKKNIVIGWNGYEWVTFLSIWGSYSYVSAAHNYFVAYNQYKHRFCVYMWNGEDWECKGEDGLEGQGGLTIEHTIFGYTDVTYNGFWKYDIEKIYAFDKYFVVNGGYAAYACNGANCYWSDATLLERYKNKTWIYNVNTVMQEYHKSSNCQKLETPTVGNVNKGEPVEYAFGNNFFVVKRKPSNSKGAHTKYVDLWQYDGYDWNRTANFGTSVMGLGKKYKVDKIYAGNNYIMARGCENFQDNNRNENKDCIWHLVWTGAQWKLVNRNVLDYNEDEKEIFAGWNYAIVKRKGARKKFWFFSWNGTSGRGYNADGMKFNNKINSYVLGPDYFVGIAGETDLYIKQIDDNGWPESSTTDLGNLGYGSTKKLVACGNNQFAVTLRQYHIDDILAYNHKYNSYIWTYVYDGKSWKRDIFDKWMPSSATTPYESYWDDADDDDKPNGYKLTHYVGVSRNSAFRFAVAKYSNVHIDGTTMVGSEDYMYSKIKVDMYYKLQNSHSDNAFNYSIDKVVMNDGANSNTINYSFGNGNFNTLYNTIQYTRASRTVDSDYGHTNYYFYNGTPFDNQINPEIASHLVGSMYLQQDRDKDGIVSSTIELSYDIENNANNSSYRWPVWVERPRQILRKITRDGIEQSEAILAYNSQNGLPELVKRSTSKADVAHLTKYEYAALIKQNASRDAIRTVIEYECDGSVSTELVNEDIRAVSVTDWEIVPITGKNWNVNTTRVNGNAVPEIVFTPSTTSWNVNYVNISFNRHHQVTEWINSNGVYSTTLFNDNGLAISQAINAKFDEVIYTSFEDNESINDDIYKYGNISQSNSFIGNQSLYCENKYGPTYNLYISGLGNNGEMYTGLDITKSYTISAWVKNLTSENASIVVECRKNNGSVASTFSFQSRMCSGWQLLEAELTSEQMLNAGLLSGDYIRFWIGNRNDAGMCYIDDIRFHPTNATIVNMCYDAEGKMTGILDGNNKKETYTYDSFGQQSAVFDYTGRLILSTTNYLDNN